MSEIIKHQFINYGLQKYSKRKKKSAVFLTEFLCRTNHGIKADEYSVSVFNC